MAIVQSFSLGQVGVTDYLICRARPVSSPGTEQERKRFGPAPSTVNNFVFTTLQPVTYYFDLYESTDGTALSFLFSTFTFDVKNKRFIKERRFYVVDRGLTADPVDADLTLTDAYFNGKNITGVFQRGFGYLIPDTDYSIAGTTITLLNGMHFSGDETWAVEIDYTATDSTMVSSYLFAGRKTVTANVTTDNTFYNKRILCNGTGDTLTITLDDYVNIPDGNFFYFVDNNGGAQKQTKIIVSSGSILYNGISQLEIWIGKGEWIWLEKNGSVFEVVQSHSNLQMVGQRFAATTKLHINTLPEDGAVYTAAEYPRLWYWLTHFVAVDSFLLDNAMTTGAYTRPVHRNGHFIISVTNSCFRMPDTQGWFERGLKDFNTYGFDSNRDLDLPGGTQPWELPKHGSGFAVGTGSSGVVMPDENPTDGNTRRATALTDDDIYVAGAKLPVKENESVVKNIGVIYLRRI